MSAKFFATVVVLALVAGSCSGGGTGDSTDGIATLRSPSELAANDSNSVRIDIEEATLEFTRCMRDKGIDVPDIRFDASGAPVIPPELVENVDLGSDEWKEAESACISIFQNASALQFSSDPELETVIQDQLREFSSCMRGEGFTDFPDPVVGNGLPYPLSAFAEFSSDEFQDALDLCQDSLAFPDLGG